MSPEDHDPAHRDPSACEAAVQVFSRVGDKWTARVVHTLAPGPRRFAEVRRSIDGISQRMLTLTLRALERDGIVARTVFPTVPPAVEYRLTELGHSMLAPVDALGAWGVANRHEIEAARRRYDGAASGDPDLEGRASGTVATAAAPQRLAPARAAADATASSPSAKRTAAATGRPAP